VRARTTLAATLVVALALALASAGLLLLQRRTLERHLDEVADLRAGGVAALVDQGRLPESLEVAGDDDEYVRVVGRDGAVLAETSGFRDVFAAVPDPPGADATVHSVDDFRVTTLRTRSGALVHVATSDEAVDDVLASLRAALLLGGPLLLALVAVTTWILSGRALRPVDRIRAEVDEISATSLDRRVPVPPPTDEVRRLATTMNMMLDRLEAGVERQRRFVADASHELQTPLAAVHTDLEVALAHPEQTPWTETAEAVLATNERMERLVRDLLYLARRDGTEPGPTGPIDLDAVILEEVARTRRPVDTSAVQPVEVRGRREELARVVRNLLDNAARHARSRVTVALATDGDGRVELAVTDDGSGIPASERDRVFERFTRLDDARTRVTGGSGLGLAIAREIVEEHGGTISVEDAGPGARVVVRLPE
jgi:signal transduction histidine kinase